MFGGCKIEPVGEIANLRALAVAVEEAKPGERARAKPGQGDILADAAHHDQPFFAPIRRKIEGSAVEHSRSRSSGDVPTVEYNPAGGDALQSEAGAADHGLAAADKPGEPDDFAGPHDEGKSLAAWSTVVSCEISSSVRPGR